MTFDGNCVKGLTLHCLSLEGGGYVIAPLEALFVQPVSETPYTQAQGAGPITDMGDWKHCLYWIVVLYHPDVSNYLRLLYALRNERAFNMEYANFIFVANLLLESHAG